MSLPNRNFSRSVAQTACLLAALSMPATGFAQTSPLESRVATSGKLTVAERLELVNIADPDAELECSNVESDNCKRRVSLASARIAETPPEDFATQDQSKAYRLLAGWAKRRGDEIDAARAETAERRERRAVAAADLEGDAARLEELIETVETETVTERTTRSSAQDAAEEGNNNKKVLTALGIVGAAVVAGSLLNNGDEVVEQQGDRLVVRRDGELVVRKDENELLRRPGSDVKTERFNDGSSRTTVVKPNGTQIVTIRDANGDTIRRTRVLQNGREVVLFDDSADAEAPIDEVALGNARATTVDYTGTDVAALRRALANQDAGITRRFSLRQVRNNARVRNLVPQIDLDGINFATGSAAIRPREAQDLARLGDTIRAFIDENPGEVFLIEGHTDAVGAEVYNLALSDRRAESVALALTEYFAVPPENLVVQGYGERFLKVSTQAEERANRRAVVRRITPLLNARR